MQDHHSVIQGQFPPCLKEKNPHPAPPPVTFPTPGPPAGDPGVGKVTGEEGFFSKKKGGTDPGQDLDSPPPSSEIFLALLLSKL